MRNIKNYVVAAFALFLLDGCDFLDYDETSGKTKEEAYSYFNNMNSSVAYIYGFLPTDFGRVSDAMMESATDNSVYTWENNSVSIPIADMSIVRFIVVIVLSSTKL